MDKKKQENLEQLAEDIRALRSALFRNRDVIKKWVGKGSIRFAIFYSGIVISLFSAFQYYFAGIYNSYNEIPPFIRTILIIAFIIAMLVPAIIKFITLFEVKDSFPETSYPGLLFKVFGLPIISYWLMIVAIIAVLLVHFYVNGLIQFAVPVLCVGFGLMFFIFGSQFGLWELNVMGLWEVITGLLSIPFISRNPLEAWIWLGLGLGVGFLIFPVIIQIKILLKKE